METTRSLSTMTLAYLAAEQLAARGDALNGCPVPGCDDYVQVIPLSSAMLASAVLALAASGAVALQPVEKRILSTTSRSVRISVVERSRLAAAAAGDAALLAVVSGRPHETVFDVVKRWFGKDYLRPREYVVRRAFAEAQREGYILPLAQSPRPRLSGGGAGTATAWPRGRCDPRRSAEIALAVAAVVERWRALERDVKLHACLLHDIDAAIRFRTKDAPPAAAALT
jgi:hypothetical protein